MLFAVLLSGCGGEPSRQLVQARDSAGVRIVESRCPDESSDLAWRLSPAPVVEIGVQAGDPDYELFGARSSTRLGDGKIVVANAGAHELRWYDAEGLYLTKAGRRGGGPGEFEGLDRVARLAGDSILAYDDERNRVSVFGPGGEPARTATLKGPRGFLTGVFGDGSLLITAQAIEGNVWVAEYRPPGHEQPRWLVFDGEYRMLGTVEIPPGFVVHEIGSDYVLGRARDEFDVEHIRLYDLIKP